MLQESRYSGISTINHWVTALLVTAMLVLGWTAAGATNEETEHYIMSAHIGLGFFALIFIIWRTAFRLMQGFPENQERTQLERWAAYAVHRLLLVLLVLQVLTGPLYLFTEGEAMSVFGWFSVYIPLEILSVLHEPMEWLHVVTGLYILPALLLVHFLGAFKHFLGRDQNTPADM